MRVGKETAAASRILVYDGQNILLETDDSNLVQSVNTLEPLEYGNLIAQRQLQSGIWVPVTYHFDGLGSTDCLTDGMQVVTDTYTYFAFGKLKASTGTTTNEFTWVGQLLYVTDPETGEYKLGIRIIDPDRDRFMSQDPLGQDPDPNEYRYTGNNPVVAVDPSGLQENGKPAQPAAAGDANCNKQVAEARLRQLRASVSAIVLLLGLIADKKQIDKIILLLKDDPSPEELITAIMKMGLKRAPRPVTVDPTKGINDLEIDWDTIDEVAEYLIAIVNAPAILDPDDKSVSFYNCETGDKIGADTVNTPPIPEPRELGFSAEPGSPEALQWEFEQMYNEPWGRAILCGELLQSAAPLFFFGGVGKACPGQRLRPTGLCRRVTKKSGRKSIGGWKSRRKMGPGDSGLKDHAKRHSKLAPNKYLERGQLNKSKGKMLKGGGKYPNARYYIRKIGPNEYSI